MKYCPRCNKKYDDSHSNCPVCEGKLVILAQKVVKKPVQPAVKKAVKKPVEEKEKPQEEAARAETVEGDEAAKKKKWLEMQNKIQRELLGLKGEEEGGGSASGTAAARPDKPASAPTEGQKKPQEEKGGVKIQPGLIKPLEPEGGGKEEEGGDQAWKNEFQKKMEEYQSNGFIVSRLEKALKSNDKAKVEEEFKRYEKDIQKLEETKKQLKGLEGMGFDNEIQEIKLLLTDPEKLITVRKKILELRTKASESDKGPVGEGVEEGEADIKDKVTKLKEEGYVTDVLEQCIAEEDDLALLEEYTEFTDNHKDIQRLSEGLNNVDSPEYEEEIKEIRSKFKNPYALGWIKNKLNKLMLSVGMKSYWASVDDIDMEEIKRKVMEWQRHMNYNVDDLAKAIQEGDKEKVVGLYKKYTERVDKLEYLSDRFLILNVGKFPQEASKIEELLNDPGKVDQLEEMISDLEKKIISHRDKMLTAVIGEMNKRISHWLDVDYKIEKTNNKFKRFKREVMKWRLGGKDIDRLEKLMEEELKDIWGDFNSLKESINQLEAIRTEVVKLDVPDDKVELKKELLEILKDPNRVKEGQNKFEEMLKYVPEAREEVTPAAEKVKAETVEGEGVGAGAEAGSGAEAQTKEEAAEVEASVAKEERKLGDTLKTTEDVDSLFQKGLSQYKSQNYKEALMYFKRILDINSEDNKANFYKKKCLAKIPETPEEEVELPFEPDPNCPDCNGSGKCPSCGGTGKCEICGGSGKCATCDGTGTDKDGNVCPDCKGNGKCFWCKGSGKCDTCDGTGYCRLCSGKDKDLLDEFTSLLSETTSLLEGTSLEEEEGGEKKESAEQPEAEPAEAKPPTKQKRKIKKRKKIKKKKLKK